MTTPAVDVPWDFFGGKKLWDFPLQPAPFEGQLLWPGNLTKMPGFFTAEREIIGPFEQN